MALFENFPYTNLHELNLDWLIQELNMIKDSAVISVNGQTGEVILYQNATVQFPPVDDDHWSIVRTADGVSRGIVFGNDNRAFICHDSLMNEIYSANNQPPYPVTRVNGQTGDIVLYADQYVQLPSLTDEQIFNWTLFRNINSVAHGIQFDADGSGYIIDGENRYKIYSQNDAPPYPVTSVNGQTGAVVLTFPVTSVNGQTGEVELFTEEATGQIEFPSVTSVGVDRVSMNRELNGVNYGLAIDDSGNLKLIIGNTEYNVYTEYDPGLVDSATDSILNVAHDATGSTWGLMRDTTVGPVGILFSNTIQNSPEAYIRYKDSSNNYQTIKLLTLADIPSSSGVVSINGLTGVVVIYGSDIAVSLSDNRTLDVVVSTIEDNISDLEKALVYTEKTNTSTHNIPAGSFVYWNNEPYISTQAISIGDTLSSTNLGSALSAAGMLNSLKNEVTIMNDVTLTPTNELASSSIEIRRYGRLVIIDGYGALTNPLSTTYKTVLIGTLSKKPVHYVQSTLTFNDGYGGILSIATDGHLEIKNYAKTHEDNAAGKGFHGQIIYLTNE